MASPAAVNAALSQAFQEREEVVWGFVASWFGGRVEWGLTVERSLFEGGVGLDVGVDSLEVGSGLRHVRGNRCWAVADEFS